MIWINSGAHITFKAARQRDPQAVLGVWPEMQRMDPSLRQEILAVLTTLGCRIVP
jgi:uncharacterized Fe-S cluster-containing MiaB family protein